MYLIHKRKKNWWHSGERGPLLPWSWSRREWVRSSRERRVSLRQDWRTMREGRQSMWVQACFLARGRGESLRSSFWIISIFSIKISLSWLLPMLLCRSIWNSNVCQKFVGSLEKWYLSRAVVLNRGWYYPPGDIWWHLETFWLAQLRKCYWHLASRAHRCC